MERLLFPFISIGATKSISLHAWAHAQRPLLLSWGAPWRAHVLLQTNRLSEAQLRWLNRLCQPDSQQW